MNTKTAIGLVAAVIVLGILIFALNSKVPQTVQIPLDNTPAPTSQATSSAVAPTLTPSGTSTSGSTGAKTPVITQEAPVASHGPRIVGIDSRSLVAVNGRATITGSANVSAVALVLDDPSGVGITGADDIEVQNGHWSFSIPQKLKPGVYTVHLIGGDAPLSAKLTVN